MRLERYRVYVYPCEAPDWKPTIIYLPKFERIDEPVVQSTKV